MDHMERGNLRFGSIEYAILDEADQMLDIGFADDMEKVLQQIKKESSSHQVLLFSATLPQWVHKVTEKYLRKGDDRITVDLVGQQKVKTNENIRFLALACSVLLIIIFV